MTKLKYFHDKFGWCISLSAAGRLNAYLKVVTVTQEFDLVFSTRRWTWCVKVDCLDTGSSTQQAQATTSICKTTEKLCCTTAVLLLYYYTDLHHHISVLIRLEQIFTKNDISSKKKNSEEKLTQTMVEILLLLWKYLTELGFLICLKREIFLVDHFILVIMGF